ncbi:hypothetical protein DENSPDRAFT_836915 [Dentipellis sp. KUC8613]|nr:hypothetical protein DENSPDRAFT_836915 [Dentipellis sp. KUC8613]
MDWKNYWEEIVFKHKVQIHGWPSGIPFGKMDVGIPSLIALIDAWESQRAQWVHVTDEDLSQLIGARQAAIASGEVAARPARALRRDFGGRRPHMQKGKAGKRNKKIIPTLSPPYIDKEPESELEDMD